MRKMDLPVQTFFATWLALTFSLALFGCGGGDLTGGSIPPGNTGSNQGKARLFATVVDAVNPDTPLAGAKVEIILPDVGTSIVVETDTSGSFSIDLPVKKKCTIKVQPPIAFASLYQESVETFFDTDADEIRLLIPIPHKDAILPLSLIHI